MKKTKLIATILTICLAISTLAYGVYAATNLSFTIGANIAFEVQNLFVDVEVTITGAYIDDGEGNLSPSTKTFTCSHNDYTSSPLDSVTLQGLFNTWKTTNLAGLQFNPDAITPITISVEVANYTPGKSVLVTITDNTAIQGGGQISTYLTKTGTGVSPVIGVYTANPAPEGVATFTYTPLSLTNAFTANFDWTVNISSPVVVTLNANGGVGAPATMAYNGTAPTAPTKEGFDFGGWYTDVNCTTGNEVNWANVPTTDVTYYAKWNVAIRTITFSMTNNPSDVDKREAFVYGSITGLENDVTISFTYSTTQQVEVPLNSTVIISFTVDCENNAPGLFSNKFLLDGNQVAYTSYDDYDSILTNYSLTITQNHTIEVY